MALRWYTIVVDCHDIAAQAQWWADVLHAEIVPPGPVELAGPDDALPGLDPADVLPPLKPL